MFELNDVNVIEGEDEVDELDYFVSVQKALNSGLWSLQGSYGRTMMGALKAGDCLLGKVGARDAYGNQIPSRFQVEPGTKGSYEWVVENRGQEWADQMREVA